MQIVTADKKETQIQTLSKEAFPEVMPEMSDPITENVVGENRISYAITNVNQIYNKLQFFAQNKNNQSIKDSDLISHISNESKETSNARVNANIRRVCRMLNVDTDQLEQLER